MGETTDFSWALLRLKESKTVFRSGWNGQKMWIKIQFPDENSKMKEPYLYIKLMSGNLVPWTPSQVDMLAEDWVVAV